MTTDGRCSRCGGPIYRNSKSGVCSRNPDCKLVNKRIQNARRAPGSDHSSAEGHKRASARRRAAHRATVLAAKIARGACCDCGLAVTSTNYMAFDFDHRDRDTKRADVSRMGTATVGALLAEIDKCDLRCANCHRIRTHREKHHLRRGAAAAPEQPQITLF